MRELINTIRSIMEFEGDPKDHQPRDLRGIVIRVLESCQHVTKVVSVDRQHHSPIGIAVGFTVEAIHGLASREIKEKLKRAGAGYIELNAIDETGLGGRAYFK